MLYIPICWAIITQNFISNAWSGSDQLVSIREVWLRTLVSYIYYYYIYYLFICSKAIARQWHTTDNTTP